jgi:hypothetical protein
MTPRATEPYQVTPLPFNSYTPFSKRFTLHLHLYASSSTRKCRLNIGADFRLVSSLQWFDEHPQFLPNPFYVAGDSYSGVIIPPLAMKIAKGS